MASRCFTLLIRFVIAAVAVLASTYCLGQSPPKPSGPQLVRLDGSEVLFHSLEIQGGKLRGEGVPPNLTLDDLRRIELPGGSSPPSARSTSIIELRGGGRIFATSVTVANEKCRLEWNG